MEDPSEDMQVPEWFQQYRHAHQRQLSCEGKARRLRRSLLQQNQQTLSYALERVRQVEFSGKHAIKPEQDIHLGLNGPAAFPTRSTSKPFNYKRKLPRRLDPIQHPHKTTHPKPKDLQNEQKSQEEISRTREVIDAYRKILLPSCSIPPSHGPGLPQRAAGKSRTQGADKKKIMFVHGNQLSWDGVKLPKQTLPSVTE